MGNQAIEITQANSVEETQAAAAYLARLVRPGDVICLDGDLGAGKTHFTQGFATTLGVAGPVSSPTFNVLCVYEDGCIPLYHFDLYRLDAPEELDDIAFWEYVEGLGVSVVEWASKFIDELPEDRLEIHLAVTSETQRTITARAYGVRAEELLDAWNCA